MSNLGPSIVKIQYSKEDTEAVGAGFFITPAGHLLTCQHVLDEVNDIHEIWVSWESLSQPVKAEYLKDWSDPAEKKDFAVLKVGVSQDIRLPVILEVGTDCQPHDPISGRGFPSSDPHSFPATGKVTGDFRKDDCRFWKIGEAFHVDKGFSGSPVLNNRTHKIIGIFTEQRLKTEELSERGITNITDKVAWVTPIDEIARELQNRSIGDKELSEFINTVLSDRGHPLSKHIRSFATLIASKSEGFVGRRFVFEAFEKFLKQNKSGYFLIQGGPGIGKTVLLSQLVKIREYPHHFNVASMNIRTPRQFLTNACAQLIARYDLPYESLPDSVADDSSFLVQCLEEAAAKPENRPVVFAIDALDESDRLGLRYNDNLLHLPAILPEGAYIVATSRQIDDLRLTVENQERFLIESGSEENLLDLRTYISPRIRSDEKLQGRLAEWRMTEETFISTLLEKSEGNFIYLSYMLPALAQGKFISGTAEDLPQGLMAYYHNHWRQVTDAEQSEQNTLYTLILGMVTAAHEPVTCEQLQKWTGEDRVSIENTLRRWPEFLEKDDTGGIQKYRVYHTSFRDFLDKTNKLGKPRKTIGEYYLDLMKNRPDKFDEDEYGLKHFAATLCDLKWYEDLYQNITSRKWFDMQTTFDSSRTVYTESIDRALKAAEEDPDGLPFLVVLTLLRPTIALLASQVPTASLEVMAKLGAVEQAESYAELRHDPSSKCEALCRIAEARCQQQDIAGAKKTFSQARKVAEDITDTKVRARALCWIARGLGHCKATGEACQVLEAAEREARSIKLLWPQTHLLAHIAVVAREIGAEEMFARSVKRVHAAFQAACKHDKGKGRPSDASTLSSHYTWKPFFERKDSLSDDRTVELVSIAQEFHLYDRIDYLLVLTAYRQYTQEPQSKIHDVAWQHFLSVLILVAGRQKDNTLIDKILAEVQRQAYQITDKHLTGIQRKTRRIQAGMISDLLEDLWSELLYPIIKALIKVKCIDKAYKLAEFYPENDSIYRGLKKRIDKIAAEQAKLKILEGDIPEKVVKSESLPPEHPDKIDELFGTFLPQVPKWLVDEANAYKCTCPPNKKVEFLNSFVDMADRLDKQESLLNSRALPALIREAADRSDSVESVLEKVQPLGHSAVFAVLPVLCEITVKRDDTTSAQKLLMMAKETSKRAGNVFVIKALAQMAAQWAQAATQGKRPFKQWKKLAVEAFELAQHRSRWLRVDGSKDEILNKWNMIQFLLIQAARYLDDKPFLKKQLKQAQRGGLSDEERLQMSLGLASPKNDFMSGIRYYFSEYKALVKAEMSEIIRNLPPQKVPFRSLFGPDVLFEKLDEYLDSDTPQKTLFRTLFDRTLFDKKSLHDKAEKYLDDARGILLIKAFDRSFSDSFGVQQSLLLGTVYSLTGLPPDAFARNHLGGAIAIPPLQKDQWVRHQFQTFFIKAGMNVVERIFEIFVKAKRLNDIAEIAQELSQPVKRPAISMNSPEKPNYRKTLLAKIQKLDPSIKKKEEEKKGVEQEEQAPSAQPVIALAVKALAQAGQIEQASKVFEKLTDSQYKALALASLAYGEAAAHDVKKAEELLKQALSLLWESLHVEMTLTAIADAIAELNDESVQLHFLRSLLSMGRERGRSEALEIIASLAPVVFTRKEAKLTVDNVPQWRRMVEKIIEMEGWWCQSDRETGLLDMIKEEWKECREEWKEVWE